MKKTKLITLAIVCAALSSCHKDHKEYESRLHMRSDTTASYTPVNNYWLWYYAFRPYGTYANGRYTRTGFYSGSISKTSNIGHSSMKSSIARGGFGGRGAIGSSSHSGGFGHGASS